ncbi:MAG: hypothetical protein ACRD08_00020, partial [Acidimicrobiales bacterium]
MMRFRPLVLLATAGVALSCSSDSSGVDADAIDSDELAAVRYVLDQALAGDSLYDALGGFVFLFIDRASKIVGPHGVTTRLVTVELDIDATTADTGSGGTVPVVTVFTTLLAWTDYQPASRTVDTVFLVLGAGQAPMNDSLRASFSPDTAGTGTGVVIHEASDSTVTTWQARTGHLHGTSASFGSGTTTAIGALRLTPRRGSVAGEFTITAKLVPDSATTVSSVKDFG